MSSASDINMNSVARTILVDVSLARSDAQSVADTLRVIDEQVAPLGLQRKFEVLQLTDSQLYIYVSKSYASGTLRIYPSKKLATLTIEESSEDQAMTNEDIESLRKQLMRELEVRVVRVPHLKRGPPVANYYTSANERLFEYDFEEILFEKKSDFQEVKILKSPTMGAVLFLDDLQNLGECDLPYTHGIMNFGDYSYTDKEILILGGGDGGLLHELLKEKPKFVTMIDIDDVVMKSCRKFLRGACGDALDSYEGDNYQVIVGDCLKYMDKYANEGRKFDAIFGDLTDVPIVTGENGNEQQHEQWQFLSKVVNDSLKLLKVGGVFQNHATGKGCGNALETYENFLKTLKDTHFTKRSRFVPSFLEDWVFYSVYLDK
ncbi:spermine synthase-like [Varroa jacobsoni]|uniref:PABS domain-containing protein n=1 Tax=Varroa destructor TaxID=109461 RepID=A0A7M7KD13_VARDE|nr:spermine synthase-like [Varroa destructor]XP_022701358.1 spermine synthase-like [Varroa jacobsoni]